MLMAQGMGCEAVRIEKANEFKPGFEAAVASGKPTVISVATEIELRGTAPPGIHTPRTGTRPGSPDRLLVRRPARASSCRLSTRNDRGRAQDGTGWPES
ncbi:MAG: hypothetical protein E5V40_25640 [Mesorhizobium sp.]|nr:MAG: hypothetical protein E5V40_25640 [Mesorhizobium sp.]